jgi:flagellar biosynthesis chaperone FliJ
VARLIEDNTFAKSTECPYRVFTKQLWVALMCGPEILATVLDQHQRTVDQLEIALKHLRMAVSPIAEHAWVMMWMEKEYYSIMREVIVGQISIEKALNFFRTGYLKRDHPTRKSKRGRGKELARQTIVQGCSEAWEELTGLRPGKANTKFHDVLSAASATVFGARDKVTGWEWQIKIFEARLKKLREI